MRKSLPKVQFVKISKIKTEFNCFHLCVFSGPEKREPDWDLFEKLRDVNEKQREQLRLRDKEYQDKLSEADSVHFNRL